MKTLLAILLFTVTAAFGQNIKLSTISGTNGQTAATVTGSNVNFSGVVTVTSGTNVLRITGTTPLVTNAFAQAMNQGVQTTSDVEFNNAAFLGGSISLTPYGPGDSGAALTLGGDGSIGGNNTWSIGVGGLFNLGGISNVTGSYTGGNTDLTLGNDGSIGNPFGAWGIDSSGNGFFTGNILTINSIYGLGGVISIGDGSGNAAYISSDGSARFVSGSVMFNPDSSAYFTYGAISLGDSSGTSASIDIDGACIFDSGNISFGNTSGLNAYIYSDGSGILSAGNITWDAAGALTATQFIGGGAGITGINVSNVSGAQPAIIRIAGTLTSGTAALSNASISGSNCWVQDNAASITNVGNLAVSTSGTTATIRSTNVLDTSPFSLFIKP